MAHTHSVTDTDIHFEIDGVTRSVKNVTETKTMLVQFDHNSERFTFKLPRYVDGHDLSLCNMVRVHYINIEKSKRTQNSGISEITDLAVCTNDQQYVTCSWLVPNTATQLAGSLHFVVQFACEENGKALYSWNTAKHTSVIVADGIDCGDDVVVENESLLTQWKNQLQANQITKIEQTVVSNEDNGENVWTVTFGDGRTQDLSVKNGSRGSTGLIGSILTLQGHQLDFFVGTQDEYESLVDKDNVFAIITDDTVTQEILQAIENKLTDGTITIDKAQEAETATTADLLKAGFTKYTYQSGYTGVKPSLKDYKVYAIQYKKSAGSTYENVFLSTNEYLTVNSTYSTTTHWGNYAELSGGYITLRDSNGSSFVPYDNAIYIREL